MSRLHVSRSHTLPQSEARTAVTEAAGELADRYGARYEWREDTLHFTGSGANGTIDVEADRVDVRLKLGLLLRPLKSRIRSEVEHLLRIHLAE